MQRLKLDNHGIHTKHGIRFLQMETTWAVLGDAGRYADQQTDLNPGC